MSLVRRATAEDAEEVLRLRQVMIDSVSSGKSAKGVTDWHTESLPTLRARLADPDGDFAAFVAGHPERPGALAALAAGTVDYRIGRTGNPHGLVGQVFSVATDPDVRRRGYARACMEELLVWLRERGAGHVLLNASPDAEPLYASLGFTRDSDPSMRLLL
ncbi:GNAT family N-acetyltransferase [Streptomyces sp. GESEQ-35]|uniref:GNAT family N-acetyltransferase n=1 Tax=Streptomyces sp. GESEQ-35 TaxID=2812657 RepID=UPI001B32E8DA|nr:GNAT family N-acetyltransferase [Streptomyces sp. GESEQ-35]